MIASGSTLHKTDIQEAFILDSQGIPIACDKEDVKKYKFEIN
ncbi:MULTISPECIES: hypothetical protein [Flavobacterium]|nr:MULTISPECIES: hypothetical protein [Flavobacterium]